MSDNTFAIAVTVGTFAFLLMWVPFLDSCAPVVRSMKARAVRVEEFVTGEFGDDSMAVD